jgi:hypothetical protein
MERKGDDDWVKRCTRMEVEGGFFYFIQDGIASNTEATIGPKVHGGGG